MTEPLVLIPGLNCDARLYAPQWPALAPGRSVMVAHNDRDESLGALVGRLLAAAPERFALCGLSMGGYAAFEVMRQAPQRVTRLALLDTTAKPPTPETNAPREQMIALAEKGAFDNVTTLLWQKLVAPSRLADEELRLLVRAMAETVGPKASSVSSAPSWAGRTRGLAFRPSPCRLWCWWARRMRSRRRPRRWRLPKVSVRRRGSSRCRAAAISRRWSSPRP